MMEWPPPKLADYAEMDGVRYRLPEWLEVGNSFFVPCLDTTHMYQIIMGHYYIREFKLTHEVTTDKNILGIRVWRVA